LGGGAAFVLVSILVYVLLKPKGLAQMWWLPGLLVLFAGLFALLSPDLLSPFTGFYLLQLPLVLWVSLDYLERHDAFTGILAYATNSIFYFIWSFEESLFSSLSLLIGAIVLLLLAMRYSYRQDFVIYTWVAAGLAAVIKVLVLGLDASWVLLIGGIFLMLVGGYLLRIKSKKEEPNKPSES
jgi:hypothetical protein